MKRWHRVLLGIWLLYGGSYLFKNSHPNSESGVMLVFLVAACIIMGSLWLFFGELKKTATLSSTSSSSASYKCVKCNKIFQAADLKNDTLVCPSCGGHVE